MRKLIKTCANMKTSTKALVWMLFGIVVMWVFFAAVWHAGWSNAVWSFDVDFSTFGKQLILYGNDPEQTAEDFLFIGMYISLMFLTYGLLRKKEKSTEKEVSFASRIQQAAKMDAVGKLAGGVAHDFNNLLTVINGYSELMLANEKEGSKSYNMIKEIKGAGKRAAKLTEQLLTFSRKQIIKPEIMDLNNSVKNIKKMITRLIGEDIELHTDLSEDLGKINADSGQIDQIIMNLAVNSRDAMPNGGTLKIKTSNVKCNGNSFHSEIAPGDYIRLCVKDTGEGMNEETQKQIFEPFFTTKKEGKGTGLGLATIYGIVKQNNGYVFVDSALGKGTTFCVYLPKVEGDVKEIKDDVAVEYKDYDKTVLIVEDEDIVKDLAQIMLEESGYNVLTAANGLEALGCFMTHEGSIDIVITDVLMPKMNGKELADAVKKINPDAKILFMSGHAENTIARFGVLDKDIDFIAKPFTKKSLNNKIGAILAA